MNAFILAAGEGRRLRPVTNRIPKCLIKIRGVVLLDLWLQKLVLAGVKKIYINVFHLSEQIISHIKKSRFVFRVVIIRERKLFGTAGSLYRSINLLTKDKELFFLHGDNYCEENINSFIKFHRKQDVKNFLTMMSFKTKNPNECGIVCVDEKSTMTKYHEKIKFFHGNDANAAVYILNKNFLELFKKNFKNKKDFSREVIPHFVKKTKVFFTKKIFDDIGTFKNYTKYL